MRDVGIFFDDPYKADPDDMFHFWAPAPSVEAYMARYFPWLDFEYVEASEEIGGEVEVHTLSVRLNSIAHSLMTLEEYYEHGAPEQHPPPETEEYVSPDDERDYYLIERAARSIQMNVGTLTIF